MGFNIGIHPHNFCIADNVNVYMQFVFVWKCAILQIYISLFIEQGTNGGTCIPNTCSMEQNYGIAWQKKLSVVVLSFL